MATRPLTQIVVTPTAPRSERGRVCPRDGRTPRGGGDRRGRRGDAPSRGTSSTATSAAAASTSAAASPSRNGSGLTQAHRRTTPATG